MTTIATCTVYWVESIDSSGEAWAISGHETAEDARRSLLDCAREAAAPFGRRMAFSAGLLDALETDGGVLQVAARASTIGGEP